MEIQENSYSIKTTLIHFSYFGQAPKISREMKCFMYTLHMWVAMLMESIYNAFTND